MKLLIVVDGVRHEVVAAGSYTVAELLQRMGSTCLSGSVDGVLSLGNLILPADGSPLLSFLSRRTCTRSSLRCTVSGTTLSDANVADRDRLILTTIASPTALGKVTSCVAHTPLPPRWSAVGMSPYTIGSRRARVCLCYARAV